MEDQQKRLATLLAQLSMEPHELAQQLAQPQLPSPSITPFTHPNIFTPSPAGAATASPNVPLQQSRDTNDKTKGGGGRRGGRGGGNRKPRGGRGRGMNSPFNNRSNNNNGGGTTEGETKEGVMPMISIQPNNNNSSRNHKKKSHPPYQNNYSQQQPQQQTQHTIVPPRPKKRHPSMNSKFAFASLARKRTSGSTRQDIVCIKLSLLSNILYCILMTNIRIIKLRQRQRLPMWEKKEEFLRMMSEHQVVVLEGHTGSGKTTQVPQFVIEAGLHSNKKVHLSSYSPLF